MASTGVVEAVDLFEECFSDLVTHLPCVPPDEFRLQGFEEGFNGCVIIAVTLAAHGYFETKLAQPLLVVMGTILATSVGMMDAACRRAQAGRALD